VQHPAGDDGGLYDDRDDVDDLVDHAFVPVERGRALPQPGQAVQQRLVARRAQVVHCIHGIQHARSRRRQPTFVLAIEDDDWSLCI